MADRMRGNARLVSHVFPACHPVCRDEAVPMRGAFSFSIANSFVQIESRIAVKGHACPAPARRFSQRQ